MESKTGTFFECKARYMKTLENGLEKKVTEQYVVEALTWTEAEARITKTMQPFGDFEITDIKKAVYKEIFISGSPQADVWYKAKVQFVAVDEKTEQKQSACYLVSGKDIDDANRGIDEIFGKSMTDYAVSRLEETAIIDVYLYDTEDRT